MACNQIDSLLFCRQEVDQECAKPCLIERLSHTLIAWAVAAAATAMREQHDSLRTLRHRQITFEADVSCTDIYRLRAYIHFARSFMHPTGNCSTACRSGISTHDQRC